MFDLRFQNQIDKKVCVPASCTDTIKILRKYFMTYWELLKFSINKFTLKNSIYEGFSPNLNNNLK